MKEVLEPLAAIPGVRLALLVTPDGVPMASCGRASGPQPEDPSALSALVSGWLASLGPALGLASWEFGRRAVLRGTRGTLVARHAGSALLLVVLEPGTSADELRLPFEAALSRLARLARGARSQACAPPPFPARIAQAAPLVLDDTSLETPPPGLVRRKLHGSDQFRSEASQREDRLLRARHVGQDDQPRGRPPEGA
ncbi:MAG: roadblock/LC7 domain-containing protein [Planctomycetes bacterium]|nr:roadblock/LC7 domain-containing protein [Planctomycetota bacterium]